MPEPFCLDQISLSDLNLLNQISLIIGSQFGWRDPTQMLAFFFFFFSYVILVIAATLCKFRNVTMWSWSLWRWWVWSKWGASFVRQFLKPYPMYLRKVWQLHLYLQVCLGFTAFVVDWKHEAVWYMLLTYCCAAFLIS